MKQQPAINVSDDEREQLRWFRTFIRNPEQLCVRTIAGEHFDCADHAAMAFLIWRRMGRSNEATGAAWRRLMESNCPTQDVIALVAYCVFDEGKEVPESLPLLSVR